MILERDLAAFMKDKSTKTQDKICKKKSALCPTSHKEVGQFYSPAASDIASQWYSAHAEWYLLRKFLEANKISLKPQGFNITIAVAIISLRRSRNITLVFSDDLCYNGANEKPLLLGEVAA